MNIDVKNESIDIIKSLKKRDPNLFHSKIENFTSKFIPEITKNRVTPDTWRNMRDLDQLGENRVCILCHCFKPIRYLVYLKKCNDFTDNHLIFPELQYEFHQLVISNNKVKDNKKIPRKIVTLKQGFFIIFNFSLKLPIYYNEHKDFSKQENNHLINLYRKFVYGMELDIFKTKFKDERPFMGLEQFMVYTFPNDKWVYAINNPEKLIKTKDERVVFKNNPPLISLKREREKKEKKLAKMYDKYLKKKVVKNTDEINTSQNPYSYYAGVDDNILVENSDEENRYFELPTKSPRKKRLKKKYTNYYSDSSDLSSINS